MGVFWQLQSVETVFGSQNAGTAYASRPNRKVDQAGKSTKLGCWKVDYNRKGRLR